LAGEVLASSLPFLDRHIHPTIIISAFKKALEDALEILQEISVDVDVSSPVEMKKLIQSSIGTKMVLINTRAPADTFRLINGLL
jgi:T-complex protein 1 subunit gamma